GFDVAMHNPPAMNFRKDGAKLANQTRHANRSKWCGIEGDAQGRTVQEGHGQTGLARFADPGIADDDYAWMLNRAQSGHFLGEVLANPALVARLRVEYFYCHAGVAVFEVA